MARLFYILFSIFVILGHNDSIAQESDFNSVVDSVQKRLDSVKSLEANFRQVAYLASVKREQISSGVVYLKKPGKMKWSYLEPEEQTIVSNGKSYWFYIPEDNQVMKKDIEGKGQFSGPNELLTGNRKLREIFDIEKGITEKSEEKNSLLVISLIPKQPSQNIKKILIGLNKSDFQIEQTTVIDYFENKTTVYLTGIKINPEIKDEVFLFLPPKGVRVIEEQKP